MHPEQFDVKGSARLHDNVSVDGNTIMSGDLEVRGNLIVRGSAQKPGGGSWGNLTASDARLKKNVATLQDSLTTLSKLRGVTFEWKDPTAYRSQSARQMGLIAQEVEKVLPEWIQEDQDGYKAMRISGFEALVVEAFKELTVINTKLSERVNTLERKLMKLEKCVQLQMHTMNEHY